MRVLMLTTEWPTPKRPFAVPFIVRQAEFLRKAGHQVDVSHIQGAKNLNNYVRAWLQTQALLGKTNYDLIHAQWGQSAIPALPKRLPLVITFRGNDLEGIVDQHGRYTALGKIQTLVSKWVARHADQLIVVSERLGRHLGNRPYHVIPSGLDLELFRPLPLLDCRRELGLPLRGRLILFTAPSIQNPRKRFSLAEAAVSKLKDRFDIELIVASRVPHQQIPKYMNACDALLLTSMHEGSPNVVKEALACNLPVVSVDVGDVAQRISPVPGCELCRSDTVEEIASALERVLLREQRINGRPWVEDLDETVLTQRVISVYNRAILSHRHCETA